MIIKPFMDDVAVGLFDKLELLWSIRGRPAAQVITAQDILCRPQKRLVYSSVVVFSLFLYTKSLFVMKKK